MVAKVNWFDKFARMRSVNNKTDFFVKYKKRVKILR